MDPMEKPPPGVASLSLPARIAVAVTVGAVAVGALYHLAMVFLHVAPSNTLSKEHASAVNDYIYPEFEQNWKLFAPDPLQQNIHVQARAEIRAPGGADRTTGWIDLTGQDVSAMRHDPVPSHSNQNLLRRAWSYYSDSHGSQDQSTVSTGDLSRIYLQRIVQDRFGPQLHGGQLVRVQVRVATTAVPQPKWIAGGGGTASPSYRQLPWWQAIAGSSASTRTSAAGPADIPGSALSGSPAGHSIGIPTGNSVGLAAGDPAADSGQGNGS
jgi:hypothetical protein